MPSKDDNHLSLQETDHRFDQVINLLGEQRADIQAMDQDYKNHLAKHHEKG